MKLQNYYSGWCKCSLMLLLISLIAVGCKDSGVTGPPSGDKNILETIESHSSLKNLAELLDGTTLTNKLSSSGKLTIFAPTDTAFDNLPEGYLEGLTAQQKLDLLKYHVYSGSYLVANEIKREVINSLHGDPLFMEIGQSFGDLINSHAKFSTTNIETSNGKITTEGSCQENIRGVLANNLAFFSCA